MLFLLNSSYFSYRYMQVLSIFDMNSTYGYTRGVVSRTCANEVFDVVCFMLNVPCSYSNCTSTFIEPCLLSWYDLLRHCGIEKCKKTTNCNYRNDFSYEKLSSFFKTLNEDVNYYLDQALTGVVRGREEGMLKWVFEEFKNVAYKMSSPNSRMEMKQYKCNNGIDEKYWIDQPTHSNEQNTNETICDPAITEYLVKGISKYYDGMFF